MPDIAWSDCGSIDLADTALTGQWLKLADLVADATLLRIVADGAWTPLPPWTTACGPDGMPGLRMDASQLMLADVPLGALIGKIGGGSVGLTGWAAPVATGTTAAIGLDGKPFAIGPFCLLQIPRLVFGPLFVAVNSTARPVPIKRLRITASIALVPAAAALPAKS